MQQKRGARCGAFVGAALVAVAMIGCGEGDSASATETETVIVKTVTERAPAPDEPREAGGGSAGGGGGGGSSYGRGGGGGGEIEVPNVVGQDHQLAQDTMQSAGLYNLSEEDATGQGRVLVLDRNWVVVEQEPPAGTMVSEDATITLRSKKIGE